MTPDTHTHSLSLCVALSGSLWVSFSLSHIHTHTHTHTHTHIIHLSLIGCFGREVDPRRHGKDHTQVHIRHNVRAAEKHRFQMSVINRTNSREPGVSCAFVLHHFQMEISRDKAHLIKTIERRNSEAWRNAKLGMYTFHRRASAYSTDYALYSFERLLDTLY